MVFKVVGNEVYEAIKAELLSGAYPQGSRIDIAQMADALHTSATPVRESLMRLAGEQLVQAVPHLGFLTPRTSDAKLRRLIEWSQYQLLPAIQAAAIVKTAPSPSVKIATNLDPVLQLESIFLAIAAIDGNPELRVSIGRTNERLRIARKARPSLRHEVEAENAALAECLAAGDYVRLEAVVLDCHRRFHALVPKIVERLETESNGE